MDDTMTTWRTPDTGPDGEPMEHCYRVPGGDVVARVWCNKGLWWWSRTGSETIVGPFASAHEAADDEGRRR